MLISTHSKISEFLLKPIIFESMMQRQLNEVISANGGFIRHQINFPDSHCFIMKPLNRTYVPIFEKVQLLFQKAKSQHLANQMLAFFSPNIKRKTTVTQ